jgi:hypothetical protein
MPDKIRENRLRRWAARLGYTIKRSRAKRLHLNDLGKYMLVDNLSNGVVLGDRFDADLDELEVRLESFEAQLRNGYGHRS